MLPQVPSVNLVLEAIRIARGCRGDMSRLEQGGLKSGRKHRVRAHCSSRDAVGEFGTKLKWWSSWERK